MSAAPSTLKTVLAAGLVAALVSAAGIGLFVVAGQPTAEPAKQQAQIPQTETQRGARADRMTEAQKTSLEKTIRDYLVKNPEILIEMSSELERRQAAAQQEIRNRSIAENADRIFRSENALVAGNPNGDVTVVEFFDYNCGFCKRAFSDLLKLLENDDKVRVVFKEFPIFGERSEGAARVAVAARSQGRYFDVHSALLKARGQASEASALKIAEELGLDMTKLREDMKSPEVTGLIQDTRALAERLGVQGTPFYLVGDRVVPGAPENLYDIFVENVAAVRKNGCAVAC